MASSAEARHSGKKRISKKEKRRRRRRRILVIEIILLIILLLFLFIWLKFGRINFQTLSNIVSNDLDEKTEEMLKGYTTIAIFGVDNRSMGHYEGGNSDSIMIASINNDTKEVKFVSVYRDTFMDVDGKGKYKKCNYAYNHGGPEKAINMLNRNLDLDIEDYVAVDFKAVVDAVDAVGGITLDSISDDEAVFMNVAYKPFIDEELGTNTPDVKPGTDVKVNGVQALCYCRVRYTSGDDFKRASRQREVMQKLIAKVKKANPIELNNLVDSLFDEISTSLSATEIMGLASQLTAYEFGDSAGYPFDKATKNLGGSTGSIVAPCTVETNVKKLYVYMFNDSNHENSDTVKKISKEVESKTGFSEGSAVDYSQYEGTVVPDPTDGDTSSDSEGQ